ncbi:helix-turn-helix domain-containing protein [Nocardia amamiensis]|uniref:helix-turn-helix domain-containing protein n=1 Tax=Nocardia amamiensis TaxID=404578 RepID=UPI0033CFA805
MADDEPDETGSTLPRRQLGRYLREAREAAGMTLQQAAELMEWGKTTLQNLETARTQKVRGREVRDLCALYGCDETKTAALIGLAQQIPSKSWYHGYGDVIPADFNLYVGLEAGARELAIYQPLVVPGLLQTLDYARAMDRTYFPNDTDDEIDRRVHVRLRRQNVYTRQRRPAKLVVVLHEAALRVLVGTPRVMAAQLRHLADVSTLDNVELRILPFRAGLPCGIGVTPFVILDFPLDARNRPVEPTIVFAESVTGSMYFERRTEVKAYREAFEKVCKESLDVRPSRDVLREMAREYDRDR